MKKKPITVFFFLNILLGSWNINEKGENIIDTDSYQ